MKAAIEFQKIWCNASGSTNRELETKFERTPFSHESLSSNDLEKIEAAAIECQKTEALYFWGFVGEDESKEFKGFTSLFGLKQAIAINGGYIATRGRVMAYLMADALVAIVKKNREQLL